MKGFYIWGEDHAGSTGQAVVCYGSLERAVAQAEEWMDTGHYNRVWVMEEQSDNWRRPRRRTVHEVPFSEAARQARRQWAMADYEAARQKALALGCEV